MGCILAAVMLGSVATAQFLLAAAKPEQIAVTQPASAAESAPGALPALPPRPQGRATVIGGTIHNVDPVRDQFTLRVFGGRPMTVLFDARTQVYLDGIKIPSRDLRSEDHASVETVLDGTSVFAVSIHMLSRSPQGECQGQVLNYNSETGELTVSGALSREPIKLLVRSGTPIVREGQAASSSTGAGLSDLVKGSLISVSFTSDNDGRGVASQIAILASPGSAFVFSGNISFLDLHSGLLVLVDPRDEKSYQVFFDPASFPTSSKLRQGEHARVTANFDGERYVASAIAVN